MANKIRAILGPPPATALLPGDLGNPQLAAIAATILDGYDGSKGRIEVSGTGTRVGGRSYSHSEPVQDFIRNFDAGNFEVLNRNRVH